MQSRTPKTKSIRVEVTDPCAGTKSHEYVTDLRPLKSGLFGKIVGSGYNAFRPWSGNEWYTNITSSYRFTLETEGMTPEEIGAYMTINRTQ